MAMRSILWVGLAVVGGLLGGCAQKAAPYGTEQKLILVGARRTTWAVAPAVNLSGQREVDPVLQADLLYQQLQQVQGLTAVPVNRVLEVYESLGITQVRSEQEAWVVCEILGCDGLLVPTVTIYDAFDPPKLGASLALMRKPAGEGAALNARSLARQGREAEGTRAEPTGVVQVVGMYDAANGSVRQAAADYAQGRNDPVGPFGAREYLVSMDRYCGFVYHELIASLLASPRLKKP